MKIPLNKKKYSKRGSALAFVLVMVTVVAIILSSLLVYITSQINYSRDRVERERAFQIAEAGIYYYRWYLAHQVAGKTAQQIQDFWNTGNPLGVASDAVVDFKDPEGSIIGQYSLHAAKPLQGSTIVTVTSKGWTLQEPSAKRTVQVRFRRPSWSENIVLSNDNMRFGQGTTVNGKIHSNKGIRFDGVATNVISSSLASYQDPDHAGGPEFGVHTHVNAPPGSGTNDNVRLAEEPPAIPQSRPDVFQAGRSFPAPQLDFNSIVSDISFMRSQASVKFDNKGAGRQIFLKTDGTMDVCKVNSYDSTTNGITDYAGVVSGATGGSSGTNGNACVTTSCCASAACAYIKPSKTAQGKCVSLSNYAIPDSGVVFVANNLWLEGTINTKKVSFVAAELTDEPGYTGGNKNVFLGLNNLLYTNSDGRDIIGIIAQKDVEIVKNSQNNLTIDAALLAKDGRVGRDAYGSNKSTITINGSLATNIRYGFAYTGANTYNCGGGLWIADGYCFRNLNFDNNLLYYPPPYFPTGTEYSIDLWDEL